MLKVTLRAVVGITDDLHASYHDVYLTNMAAPAAAERAIAQFRAAPEAIAFGPRLRQLTVVRVEGVADPPHPEPLNTDILRIAEHYVYNDHKAEQATL